MLKVKHMLVIINGAAADLMVADACGHSRLGGMDVRAE